MLSIRPHRERRRWTRRWLNAPVRLLTNSAAIEGRALMMSDGGISLFALADLTVGSELEVEVASRHSEESILKRGVVRNRTIYLYGIEFCAETAHQVRHPKALTSTLD